MTVIILKPLGTRNELVHANYAAQVSHRQTDVLTTVRTMISSLVTDQLFGMESTLSLFLSIWAMLQTDCMGILMWLQGPRQPGVCHSLPFFPSGADPFSAIPGTTFICCGIFRKWFYYIRVSCGLSGPLYRCNRPFAFFQ